MAPFAPEPPASKGILTYQCEKQHEKARYSWGQALDTPTPPEKGWRQRDDWWGALHQIRKQEVVAQQQEIGPREKQACLGRDREPQKPVRRVHVMAEASQWSGWPGQENSLPMGPSMTGKWQAIPSLRPPYQAGCQGCNKAGIAALGQAYAQAKGHEATERHRKAALYPALGPFAPTSFCLTSYLCVICYAHDAVGVVG